MRCLYQRRGHFAECAFSDKRENIAQARLVTVGAGVHALREGWLLLLLRLLLIAILVWLLRGVCVGSGRRGVDYGTRICLGDGGARLWVGMVWILRAYLMRRKFGCRRTGRARLTCSKVVLTVLWNSEWGRQCLGRSACAVPVLRVRLVVGLHPLAWMRWRLRHVIHDVCAICRVLLLLLLLGGLLLMLLLLSLRILHLLPVLHRIRGQRRHCAVWRTLMKVVHLLCAISRSILW